jgi:tetratricopeptide (TPR) repeat protein
MLSLFKMYIHTNSSLMHVFWYILLPSAAAVGCCRRPLPSAAALQVAIDLANTSDSQSTQFPQPVSPLLHACFSNRAACFLKLGQLEKALQDADSCVATAPAGFVKGHFRRGLALHAMGQYNEALPSLGKALRLEDPKNKVASKQNRGCARRSLSLSRVLARSRGLARSRSLLLSFAQASVKQIEQAITFAERKLQEELRKRMGR